MKTNIKIRIFVFFLIVSMINMALELRIMSYNIYGLRNHSGEELANVLKKYKPDIISLQEVDRNTRRSKGRDVTADIANVLGYTYYYFQNTLNFDGGEFGISIISKYPIKEIFTYKLPSLGEQRHLIGIKLDEEILGEKITIINTHFDYRIEKIEEQLDAALRIVEEFSEGITFLSGDLNFLPQSKFYNKIREYNWIDTYHNKYNTIKNLEKDIRIDYIFGDNSNKWEIDQSYFIKDRSVNWVEYSDHFPYMARVKIK